MVKYFKDLLIDFKSFQLIRIIFDVLLIVWISIQIKKNIKFSNTKINKIKNI